MDFGLILVNLGFGNFDFGFMIAFRWSLWMSNEGFRWVGGINEIGRAHV